ncbi:hypothetical protein IWQ61_006097 [Dispira simplex]|nr:hypothetical protein IWQ61_006097 [Dispira simplex]
MDLFSRVAFGSKRKHRPRSERLNNNRPPKNPTSASGSSISPLAITPERPQGAAVDAKGAHSSWSLSTATSNSPRKGELGDLPKTILDDTSGVYSTDASPLPQTNAESHPGPSHTVVPQRSILSDSDGLSRTAVKFPLTSTSRERSDGSKDWEEQVYRKARAIFDTQQKLNFRFANLLAFLDCVDHSGKTWLFRIHSEAIFGIIQATVQDRYTCIQRKSTVPESPTIKEVVALWKPYTVLRKLLYYVTDRVKRQWKVKEIRELLAIVVHPHNHRQLFRDGFILLLEWMNLMGHRHPIVYALYREALMQRLSLTETGVYGSMMSYPAITQDNSSLGFGWPTKPVCRASSPDGPEGMQEIVQLILSNVKLLADLSLIEVTQPGMFSGAANNDMTSDNHPPVSGSVPTPRLSRENEQSRFPWRIVGEEAWTAAEFMYEAFKEACLLSVLPTWSQYLYWPGQMRSPVSRQGRNCHAILIRPLIQFLLKISSPLPPTPTSTASLQCSSSSKDVELTLSNYPAVTRLILGSDQNLALICVVLEQALDLPVTDIEVYDVMAGAIQILRQWVCQTVQGVPCFLQFLMGSVDSDKVLHGRNLGRSLSTSWQICGLVYVRHFFTMTSRLIHKVCAWQSDFPALVTTVCSNVFDFIQQLVVDQPVPFDDNTWRLFITQHVAFFETLPQAQGGTVGESSPSGFASSTRLAELIPELSPQGAALDSFVGNLVETWFVCIIASPVQDAELWQSISRAFNSNPNWLGLVDMFNFIVSHVAWTCSQQFFIHFPLPPENQAPTSKEERIPVRSIHSLATHGPSNSFPALVSLLSPDNFSGGGRQSYSSNSTIGRTTESLSPRRYSDTILHSPHLFRERITELSKEVDENSTTVDPEGYDPSTYQRVYPNISYWATNGELGKSSATPKEMPETSFQPSGTTLPLAGPRPTTKFPGANEQNSKRFAQYTSNPSISSTRDQEAFWRQVPKPQVTQLPDVTKSESEPLSQISTLNIPTRRVLDSRRIASRERRRLVPRYFRRQLLASSSLVTTPENAEDFTHSLGRHSSKGAQDYASDEYSPAASSKWSREQAGNGTRGDTKERVVSTPDRPSDHRLYHGHTSGDQPQRISITNRDEDEYVYWLTLDSKLTMVTLLRIANMDNKGGGYFAPGSQPIHPPYMEYLPAKPNAYTEGTYSHLITLLENINWYTPEAVTLWIHLVRLLANPERTLSQPLLTRVVKGITRCCDTFSTVHGLLYSRAELFCKLPLKVRQANPVIAQLYRPMPYKDYTLLDSVLLWYSPWSMALQLFRICYQRQSRLYLPAGTFVNAPLATYPLTVEAKDYAMLGPPFVSTAGKAAHPDAYMVTLAALCRLMSRVHSGHILMDYITYFYHLVFTTMASRDVEMINVLFNNLYPIFSVALPKNELLVVPFINCIRSMLPHQSGLSDRARANAVRLIFSTIMFIWSSNIDTYPTILSNPQNILVYGSSAEPTQCISRKVIYDEAIQTIVYPLTRDAHDWDSRDPKVLTVYRELIHGLCMLSMAVIAQRDHNLAPVSPRQAILRLAQLLEDPTLELVRLAEQSLGHICHMSEVPVALPKDLQVEVTHFILCSIHKHLDWFITSPNEERTQVLKGLQYCLYKWLMSLPADLIKYGNLRSLVFRTLGRAYDVKNEMENKVQGQQVSSEVRTMLQYLTAATRESIAPFFEDEHRLTLFNPARSPPKVSTTPTPVSKQETNQCCQFIRQMAEAVTDSLLAFYDHYPPLRGPNYFQSKVQEPFLTDERKFDENYVVMGINGRSIVTRYRSPVYESNPLVLVRNPMEDASPGEIEELFPNVTLSEISNVNLPDTRSGQDRPASHTTGLQWPTAPFESPNDRINSDNLFQQQLAEFVTLEQQPQENLENSTPSASIPTSELKNNKVDQPMGSSPLAREPNQLASADPVSGRSQGKKNGHMTMPGVGLHTNLLAILQPSKSLFRDLRYLDNISSRESFKFAVFYVGSQQIDETAILSNTQGSAAYDAFLLTLGWEVDLSTHSGYTGRLARDGSDGTTAIYYSGASAEIIFHDSTRIPVDPGDKQFVNKKRHVGNDHVHIVWNENNTSFIPGTISGDFGNVIIIIHPLNRDMCGVRIHKERNVPNFGPLLDGTVVPWFAIGPLVRTTAAQAQRLMYSKRIPNAPIPFSSRKAEIANLIDKHAKIPSTSSLSS